MDEKLATTEDTEVAASVVASSGSQGSRTFRTS
jgi:hypothetical protein